MKMTRADVELALIRLGQAAQAIVAAYQPDANQVRISVVDGNVMVFACRYDGDDAATNADYLDATRFDSGEIKIMDEYLSDDFYLEREIREMKRSEVET